MNENRSELGILILRLSMGLGMLLAHGWGKLIGFSNIAPNFPALFGLSGEVNLALAVFAEAICAALVALGLFTRFAAIPMIITMAVAFFMVHGADPFAKKELAFLYLMGYVVIFLNGSGKYSLQSMLRISSQSRLPFISWLMK